MDVNAFPQSFCVPPPGFTRESFPAIEDLSFDQYYLQDMGKRCEELGGGLPRAIALMPGLASPLGHYVNDEFHWETTLYGLNPMYYQEAHYTVKQYRDWRASSKGLEGKIRCIGELEYLVAVPGLWDLNYQHFIVESLPLIHYLSLVPSLSNVPILVNDSAHIREILGLLYPGREFIFCPQDAYVRVARRALYITPVARNGGEIVESSVCAFRYLRECVLAALSNKSADAAPSPSLRKVYIGRRVVAGLNYSGLNRAMVNECDLQSALVRVGWELDAFDGLSLADKARLLSSASIAMLPVGANLMNLLFAPKGIRLILIGHPLFKPEKFFLNLFKSVDLVEELCLLFDSVFLADGAPGFPNSPFSVDLDKLFVEINRITALDYP